MSILVTGGAGFIGRHLIHRLLRESDQPILSLDNFNDYYDPALKRANAASYAGESQVELIEADFCQADQMQELFARQDVSQVVHLGAYAGVRYSIENPLVYQHANVCGTASVLEAARRHPVRRFVLASSSTVYGEGAAAPFVEDAPQGIPLSPYGASKRAAELLCQTFWQLYDVPTVSLRLFSVYGPGLRPDLAMTIFTDKIIKGEALPLFGDGSIRRDFTHVDDICSGILAALQVDEAVGQAFNLGHDEPVEVRQLIAMLESEIGKSAVIENLPASPGDMPVTHADLSKSKRVLNYAPQMPFTDGIKQYVAWFRETCGD